jgi:hypothetical protein
MISLVHVSSITYFFSLRVSSYGGIIFCRKIELKWTIFVSVKPTLTLRDDCLGRYNIFQKGSKCPMERFEASWSDLNGHTKNRNAVSVVGLERDG